MHSASRDSYAAARERLDEQARGAQPEAITQLAGDLLALAGLLSAEPRLRRALSDPGRAGEDRAQLMTSVLGDRLSAQARELAAVLAGGRWSAAVDLLDAAEQLGVEALLASAESAGTLGEVEDALFRFGQVADGDPRLAAVLGDSSAAAARRRELVRSLLADKVDAVTTRLAELSVEGFGGRNFSTSLARLVELAAHRRERRVAYVTTAAPISPEQEERLADNLGRIYGGMISLKVSVRPDVLGGISVQIGDDLYDGTILRRLSQARGALAVRNR